MKITKTVLARIWWLGRGTATTMGVAVMLALTVGLASTALAGTGVGARFELGKTNTVNAVSKLVGNVAGASLLIDNNSANASATALDLQVQPGKAPMKVNPEAGTAINLSADKLDGKSANEIGVNGTEVVVTESAQDSVEFKRVHATCPVGKVAVSTGFHVHDELPGVTVAEVIEVIPEADYVEVTAVEKEPTTVNWGVDAYATCATGP